MGDFIRNNWTERKKQKMTSSITQTCVSLKRQALQVHVDHRTWEMCPRKITCQAKQAQGDTNTFATRATPETKAEDPSSRSERKNCVKSHIIQPVMKHFANKKTCKNSSAISNQRKCKPTAFKCNLEQILAKVCKRVFVWREVAHDPPLHHGHCRPLSWLAWHVAAVASVFRGDELNTKSGVPDFMKTTSGSV